MAQDEKIEPEKIEKAENKNANKKQQNDIEQNKVLAGIGYIGILFLVPLLAAKDSPFAQYHAKQSINLFIVGFIGAVVGGIIPILGWLIITPIVSIAWLILAIMGLVSALNGEKKELPIVGALKIVK